MPQVLTEPHGAVRDWARGRGCLKQTRLLTMAVSTLDWRYPVSLHL